MLQMLSEYINHTEDVELSEIIQTAIHRYSQIHPGWEIMFLSLPKNDPVLRQKTIDGVYSILKRNCE